MAATVTYEYPVTIPGGTTIAGGTTGPTSGWGGNAVTATLAMLDTDTTATFVHGFGLSIAELNALFPMVVVYQQATNGSAVGLSFTSQSFNSFTITKASLTSSGGTWVIQAYRPYSPNK